MIIRLLFIVRRRWPIVILLPLLGAGLGIVFTPTGQARTADSYQATSAIAVDQQLVNQTSIQQTLIEAEQGEVASQAATELGTTPERVGSVVRTSFDEATFVIEVRAVSGDPTVADDYAEAFSDAFVDVTNASATSDASERLLDATEQRNLAKGAVDGFLLANDAAINGPNPPQGLQIQLQQLQQVLQTAEANLAAVQAEPTEDNIYRKISDGEASLVASNKLELPASRLLRLILGLMLGAIGAAVLVAIVEKLNPRIDDPEHASELIGAPVLAMVPVMGRKRSMDLLRADPENFRGPFAEAFRSMRAHLDFRAQADGHETPPRIMVTSATPSEGKSTSAAFMALSYAEAGRPPVVIGADLRRPSIHKIFDVERLPGLSSRATVGGSSIPLSEIVKTDPVTGVSVVPSGPAVDRITGLLDDLIAITRAGQDAGRVVIVDTPPVMVANDATDFLAATDWVVVVVRVGRSTERSVKQMMTTLNLNEAHVVGVVMVGSVESSDAKRYYYSYYSIENEGRQSRRVTRIPEEPVPEGGRPITGSIEPGDG